MTDLEPAIRRLTQALRVLWSGRESVNDYRPYRANAVASIRSYVAAIRILRMAKGAKIVGGGKC
jgi:hypothetical protein